MTSITFLVTDSAQTVGREDTQQVFDIPLGGEIVLSEFTVPERIFNRTHASAQDYGSGRGTHISKHKESTIGFTFPIALLPAVEELIDSLGDWQVASLDATDIDFVGAVHNFKMTGTNFPRETIGCTHLSCSMRVQFFP